MFTSETESTQSQLLWRATQLRQVGDGQSAARLYQIAGEEAARLYAIDEAVDCFSQALALTPDSQLAARFTLLRARGKVYALQGRRESQKQDLSSMATLADTLDDDYKRTQTAVDMARYKLVGGDYQDTVHYILLAIQIARQAKAKDAEVALNVVWGEALLRLMAYDQAESKLRQALSQAQAFEMGLEVADSLRLLGVVNMERGEFARAKEQYATALEGYESIGEKQGLADVLNNLGNVAHAIGEFDEALHYWDKAQGYFEAIGDRKGSCRLLINQSAVCMDIGSYDEAKGHNEAAKKLSREIGLFYGECLASINLAVICLYQGDNEGAVLLGRFALKLAKANGNSRLQGYALKTLGHAHSTLKEGKKAADAYWQAIALWQTRDQINQALEARAGLARLLLSEGQSDEALNHVGPILKRLPVDPELGGTESPLRIYLTCYQVLCAGQDDRAVAVLEAAHNRLQQQAAAISNESQRHSFLNNVAVHQKITRAFLQSQLTDSIDTFHS